MYFIAGIVVGLLIFILFVLAGGNDDSTAADWNSNCQYGNEYMMPDGTVVKHSECK